MILTRAGLVREAAVFCAYLAVVLGCQYASGATALGFGSYPDESSHYITGLMVHDYLRSGLTLSPLAYARQYYLYLPLLGIGHWPPLFYGVEALWMLIFGISRGRVLFLIACITACLAYTLYAVTRRSAGALAAFLSGIWLIALPVVRWSGDLVMLDVFAALLILWAAIAFGRFLRTERVLDAWLFGLLAGAAFLAKPAALCLAFVPPLAIVLTRRYSLLLKPALWISAAIVAVCAVPWYYATLPLALYGHNSLGFAVQVRENLPLFFQQIWSEMSFLALLALIGLGIWVRRAKTSLTNVEACLAVLPLAVLISVLLAKVDLEPRYDIPAMAPLLIAAAAGASALLTLAARKTGRAWIAPAGLLICTAAFAAASHMPALIENAAGVAPLASRTLHEAGARGATILVAAPSAAREGRIMAELAMQSPKRPLNVIVRATKLLADIDWNATTYATCCQTPAAVMQVLERSGVALLVLDVTGNAPPAWTHYQLLTELPGASPSHFQELGAFPANAHPTYRLYRVISVPNPAPRPDLMLKKLEQKFTTPGSPKP